MNEVGWFDFETRIRDLVMNMIDPIGKRGLDDRDKLVKLRTEVEHVKRKNDDIEFAISKMEVKIFTIEDLYKKINRIVKYSSLNNDVGI